MKKTLYSLSIFALGLVNAQKVDVKVSYGTASVYGLSESIVRDVVSIIIPGNEVADYTSNGVIAVDVMLHSSNNKWRYGLGYQNEMVKDDRFNVKGNFNTLLAQADYSWLYPDRKFKLYSGAGVGAIMTKFSQGAIKDDSDVGFAFNVTPIGLSYGEKFAVFVETNVGTKGIVQGGVSYTF